MWINSTKEGEVHLYLLVGHSDVPLGAINVSENSSDHWKYESLLILLYSGTVSVVEISTLSQVGTVFRSGCCEGIFIILLPPCFVSIVGLPLLTLWCDLLCLFSSFRMWILRLSSIVYVPKYLNTGLLL